MVKRLLYLNGLAILGAVIHHSIHWVVIAMVWWADRYKPVSIPDYSQIGSPTFFALAVIDQICVFGVPAFLFVSGYFIAIATGQTRATVGWEMVLNRIKRLLIPYLIWTVVVMVWNLSQGDTYTLTDWVWVFLAGKAESPFYFVPLIIQLYLLSPWLARMAKKHPKMSLAVSGLLVIPVMIFYHLTLRDIKYPSALEPLKFLWENWRVLEFTFWFMLGMVTGFHLEAVKNVLSRIRVAVYASNFVILVLAIIEWEQLRQAYGHEWISIQNTFFGKFFMLLLILSFLASDRARLPFNAAIGNIGARSFGIYMMHFTIQEVAARAIATVTPGVLAYYFVVMILVSAAGIIGPMIFMELINRSPAKRAYIYLFG